MAGGPVDDRRPPPRKAARSLPVAVGTYVIVLISLQLFLLMLGLEAWLTYDAGLAWGAAITSAVLAATAGFFYRFLRAVRRR